MASYFNQSINQDILNAPANKYHVGAHGKMNGIKIKLNGNKCTTKKLICICIRFWKKESFQFVPKTADGEYRITQIIGERVPNSRGSVEEAARADCLRFRSRDNEKTLLEPGWAQGGTGGRYLHRDAIVGEVLGSEPVEALVDE